MSAREERIERVALPFEFNEGWSNRVVVVIIAGPSTPEKPMEELSSNLRQQKTPAIEAGVLLCFDRSPGA